MTSQSPTPTFDLELGLVDTMPLMQLPDTSDTSGAATHSSMLPLSTPDDPDDSDADIHQQILTGRLHEDVGGAAKHPRPLHGFVTRAPSITYRIEQRLRRSRFHGWRMGVLIGCCMSTLVLLCNIAMIVAGAVKGYGDDGIADLITGDETNIPQWNTAFHIFINALSTVLLAGSNYTMQVLSSPTREDIDKAHASNRWLEVGILSPRNMRSLPRKRGFLCLILSLSSIPLHLFYNASVFKVTTSNEWYLHIVDMGAFDYNRTVSYSSLGNKEWHKPYTKQYVSGRGDLFLIVDRVAYEIGDHWCQHPRPEPERLEMLANRWTVARLIREAPEWITMPYRGNSTSRPVSAHVAYAQSLKSEGRSRVQISLYFMVVVVMFNFLKLVVMIVVLVSDRSAYLVTLGDAASSFLKRPDPHTDGKCIMGKEELFATLGIPALHPNSKEEEAKALELRSKGTWCPRPRRYLFSINRHAKVIYTMLVLLLAILLACLPLYTGASRPNPDPDRETRRWTPISSWDWGSASNDFLSFGSDDTTSTGTLYNAWLANMPQLFLSFAYLNINTICTSMAFAQEWNRLATFRKYLRVTKPVGKQRSTYFLQLPYRWSIPLITVGGVMHWLLSQTFFLVRIDFYNREGEITRDSKSACGFSVLCLTVFIAVASLLLTVIGVIGFWKIPMTMPVAGSCSLAISAACHPASDEDEPHLKAVQWGVVDIDADNQYGHCSLSSKSVKVPVYGETYR